MCMLWYVHCTLRTRYCSSITSVCGCSTCLCSGTQSCTRLYNARTPPSYQALMTIANIVNLALQAPAHPRLILHHLPHQLTAPAVCTATTVIPTIVTCSICLGTAATAHMTQPTCSGVLMTCTRRMSLSGLMRHTWTIGVTCCMTQVSPTYTVPRPDCTIRHHLGAMLYTCTCLSAF